MTTAHMIYRDELATESMRPQFSGHPLPDYLPAYSFAPVDGILGTGESPHGAITAPDGWLVMESNWGDLALYPASDACGYSAEEAYQMARSGEMGLSFTPAH